MNEETFTPDAAGASPLTSGGTVEPGFFESFLVNVSNVVGSVVNTAVGQAGAAANTAITGGINRNAPTNTATTTTTKPSMMTPQNLAMVLGLGVLVFLVYKAAKK